MALAGSGASSVNNLKYPSFLYEKGWRTADQLRKQRLDLLLSVVTILVMSLLIQVAAAAALQPMGVKFKTAQDLELLYMKALGEPGRVMLGLGLWAAVFTTFLGSNTGYSLVMTEIWRSLRSPAERQTPPEPGSTKKHPVYRICVAWFCLSPLYVLATDFEPVVLVLATSALFVVLLPVSSLVLLRLGNDKGLLGEYRNKWFNNVALGLIGLAAIYLTWQNGKELLFGVSR
jgi:Mn2+/Fe2+ NRAMP family transporter